MMSYRNLLLLFVPLLFMASPCIGNPLPTREQISADEACIKMTAKGLRPIAKQQSERFLGKVSEDIANCRGGEKALDRRNSVWVDWANYWGTGDASSKAGGWEGITKLDKHLNPNGRGVDGALILEKSVEHSKLRSP